MRLSRRQAIGVAAVIALIVAVLVYVVLNRRTAPSVTPGAATVAVVVATTTIPAYEEVKNGDIEVKQVPREQAPSDALHLKAEAIGRIAQVELSKDQILTRGDVRRRSAEQGLAFVLPEGMRAATVALDPISGVAGFVFPRDRVDVLATFEGGKEQALTRTILQDIEVLAMNEETMRPAPKGPPVTDEEGEKKEEKAPAAQQVKSATLAVTPHQAQLLILSATKGTIHLVLRGREDREQVALLASNEWDLMGRRLEPVDADEAEAERPPWPPEWGPPPGAVEAEKEEAPEEAVKEEAPPPPTVEVIRDNERELVVVQ